MRTIIVIVVTTKSELDRSGLNLGNDGRELQLG